MKKKKRMDCAVAWLFLCGCRDKAAREEIGKNPALAAGKYSAYGRLRRRS